MKYRWSAAAPPSAEAGNLAKACYISPLLAQCLLNRGLTHPEAVERFLHPWLKHLRDPFLLPGMRPAVERLLKARAAAEPVVIFGDYDVDGVTGATLLLQLLRALGWKVEVYLPRRMDEGYGLSATAVQNCIEKFKPNLLLALDCGSTAVEAITWLNQRGVDVIVLDHHQVSKPAPPALALVNPRALAAGDELAPFTELCSVGLAFKLGHALLKHGRENGLPGALDYDLRQALDLVALGTVADLVPLTGENRILVCSGLAALNRTRRPGLLALREAAGMTGPIAGHEVGFQLGPRLNAAGRLETAMDALELLLAQTQAEAMPLACKLDAQNRERQRIEREIAQEVLQAVAARFDPQRDYVVVQGSQSWHVGVVGIVASRVVQEFYRPTIIFGGDGSEWRGSGRSIEGFDLAAGLRGCSDLLLRHGGHTMAAGLAISPQNLPSFRERLNGLARQALKPEALQPALCLDAEVTTGEMTLERLQELQQVEQTGQGNPPLKFWIRNVWHQRPPRRMGADGQHARFWVTDGGEVREAVYWRVGNRPLPEGRFDLAFTPTLNQYNGSVSVQLKVLDWRPASGDGSAPAELLSADKGPNP